MIVTKICPQCGGTGWYSTDVQARYGDNGGPCSMCKRTGKVEREEPMIKVKFKKVTHPPTYKWVCPNPDCEYYVETEGDRTVVDEEVCLICPECGTITFAGKQVLTTWELGRDAPEDYGAHARKARMQVVKCGETDRGKDDGVRGVEEANGEVS